MKLRPTIFLSGVSSEFASFREERGPMRLYMGQPV